MNITVASSFRSSALRALLTRSVLGALPRRLVSSSGPSGTDNTNSLDPAELEDGSYYDSRHKYSHHRIPPHRSHKVCTAADAVSLIHSEDTICVSGFVGQGSPDKILHALADHYDCSASAMPNDLTLLFGGGPGDWDTRGLNYVAKMAPSSNTNTNNTTECRPLIKRAIGAHYGQVPMLGNLATSNQIEAWTLPLGSISRMIRAQATHSPGHLTTVGLGTYVDPAVGSGGAANELAFNSRLHPTLVSRQTIQSSDFLLYRALPIQVAIIRATTGDSTGNLTLEQESLFFDQRITALAAQNSGGIVIAQVKRLAQVGSLPARSVGVPGALVDCVVVVEEEEHERFHPMSFTMPQYDPVLTCEIKSPVDYYNCVPANNTLDERKIIARRACFALKPGKVVNLGIGLPEGVASVAGEEGMLDYVTLTTEAGVFGGLPAAGRNFGPSVNADAIIEMNQMFDFYDGGGLDLCFLGAAQVSPRGDVNVSRLSKDRLTGPGGFIDISQSTRNICFLLSFTAKGLDIAFDGEKGEIDIVQDGTIKKFVNNILETTFSGDEAVRRGQKVYYVTERAVFRRTANSQVLELIEIAPGVDLQKDILNQMEYRPSISPDLRLMDERIFKHAKMELELFGSLEDRCTYHDEEHVIFIDLFGVMLASESEINWFMEAFDNILHPLTAQKGPVDAVVSYHGFDLRSGLEGYYEEKIAAFQQKHYRSVKRFTGKAFKRAALKTNAKLQTWDEVKAFKEMNLHGTGTISREELREGMRDMFGVRLTLTQLDTICRNEITIDNFTDTVVECLKVCE